MKTDASSAAVSDTAADAGRDAGLPTRPDSVVDTEGEDSQSVAPQVLLPFCFPHGVLRMRHRLDRERESSFTIPVIAPMVEDSQLV